MAQARRGTDGRPPSADAAWSMVILPDTQNYSKSAVDSPIFTQQTQWIRDNRDAFKIQVVLQEGDVVNKNNNETPTTGELPSVVDRPIVSPRTQRRRLRT